MRGRQAREKEAAPARAIHRHLALEPRCGAGTQTPCNGGRRRQKGADEATPREPTPLPKRWRDPGRDAQACHKKTWRVGALHQLRPPGKSCREETRALPEMAGGALRTPTMQGGACVGPRTHVGTAGGATSATVKMAKEACEGKEEATTRTPMTSEDQNGECCAMRRQAEHGKPHAGVMRRPAARRDRNR